MFIFSLIRLIVYLFRIIDIYVNLAKYTIRAYSAQHIKSIMTRVSLLTMVSELFTCFNCMHNFSFTFRELFVAQAQVIMEKYFTKKSKSDSEPDQLNTSSQSKSSEKSSKEKQEYLKHKSVRKFNNDWQNEFSVIERNDKPFCLLCLDVGTENRKFNIERHSNSKHSDINIKFLLKEQKK